MARSLEVLGDPWSILILRELFSGAHHFSELRENLDAADTVLSDRLARLCKEGVVERVPYKNSKRPRYTYHLTEAGAATLPLLHALAQWGLHHRTPDSLKDTGLQAWCTTCGNAVSDSIDWCTHCQAPLTVANTAWRRAGRSDEILQLSAASPRHD